MNQTPVAIASCVASSVVCFFDPSSVSMRVLGGIAVVAAIAVSVSAIISNMRRANYYKSMQRKAEKGIESRVDGD